MKRIICLVGLVVAMGAGAQDPQDSGAIVWKGRCKGCHGVDGKAQTGVGRLEHIADFSTDAWQKGFADPDIQQVIANGSPSNAKMKPYADKLSPEDIAAVTRYIRTLKAK